MSSLPFHKSFRIAIVFTQQIAQSKIVTLEQNGRFSTNHFPDYQCSNTDDVQGIISSTGEVDLLLKSSQSGTELSFQSNRSFLEKGKLVIRGIFRNQLCDLSGVFELRKI
ncbi:MAG: hypothetical protein WA896_01740 [Spirulinaceae cyanobacterium]